MSYTMLTIRTAEFEDGALYPVLGDERNEIEFEALDGRDVKTLYAESLTVLRTVGSKLVTQAKVSDIKATVFVTDARVAIACTKYDKGGGWRGASLAVPVLNLASKARAATRRRGKMLVGHVRYPWLVSVGFIAKTSWSTSDQIRLTVAEKVDGNAKQMHLDLTFPKGTDVAKLAQVIAQRAAAYRLTHDVELADAERAAFEALVRGGTAPAPQPKQFTVFRMPTYFNVNRTTAYPKAEPIPTTSVAPAARDPRAEGPQVEQPRVEQPMMVLAGGGTESAVVDGAVESPARAAVTQAPTSSAQWAEDPYGRHELRYWDGSSWSEHVSDAGVASTDRWPR